MNNILELRTISKSLWLQFLPAMVFGCFTIGLLVVGAIPLYYLWATFIMWILVSGLGIAVGYHRVFSHKTHTLPPWKEVLMLFFACFAAQGASVFWVAMHRGYHHPHSDTEKDIHSPVVYGRWKAFVGWQTKVTERYSPINIKYAVDLLKKPHHLWFHRHHLKVLWGVPLAIAIFDWKLALTGFWLVSMFGVLQDNLVNVFGHIKHPGSYRNFDTRDNSQNSLLLGYLTWGQGWHNNHHYDPKSYNFGSKISKKWWEVDPCVIFTWFLADWEIFARRDRC